MADTHKPRLGSMQFWPRKRSRHSVVRVRSWQKQNQAKPLAFIGYKAGMTHVLAVDNRPKALTKGQDVSLPATIIDCPPMVVAGISFYKNSKKISQVFSSQFDKHLAKKIQLPKKGSKKIEEVKEFDDLRILVHTQPKLTGIGTKKPKLMEIGLGGSKEEKLEYSKKKLGQELTVEEVFEPGVLVDAHGITKGKGFQGTVKRFGVPIRQHKAEKTKRGIGNLGSWTPKRVQFTVPQSGKMGYHQRTEYNKKILRISSNPEEVNPLGGIAHFGKVKNHYILLHGSIPGTKKRAVMLVTPVRSNKKIVKEVAEIKHIAK
ncbi:MAG: 50S ribosomal protein L3 [Candidatus Woesearchaeota archaeon]